MYRKCGIAFALIKKDGMLKFFTVCFPKCARVAGYKSDRMNYSKGVISGFFLPRMFVELKNCQCRKVFNKFQWFQIGVH